MTENQPAAYPRVTPYLLYEDVPAALEWLSRTFGFRERLRFKGKDGTVNHAEMEIADAVIMLGDPGRDYRNPKRLGGVTQYVHVYVDDVDAHHRRATQAGATISAELKDQEYGDRSYSARDPEGHAWTFAQHVRDVAPAEWGATVA
jgi:PhnB protein